MKNILNQLNNPEFNIYNVSFFENGKYSNYSLTSANKCNNCYSVAKAFTATAIGLLCDEGKLSPSDRITDILSSYNDCITDNKWHRATVSDALRHRIGLGIGGLLDIDVDDIKSYNTTDFLKYVFSKELQFEPGEKYIYTDAAFYILSRIVSEISGERLDDYLISRLFNPLEFSEIAWSKCPLGYSMGATGLYLRAEDTVKLGVLYLQKGLFNNKRVLSEEYINKALTMGYGLNKINGKNAYAKGGMHGQLIYFNYDTNVAIACQAYDKKSNGANIILNM